MAAAAVNAKNLYNTALAVGSESTDGVRASEVPAQNYRNLRRARESENGAAVPVLVEDIAAPAASTPGAHNTLLSCPTKQHRPPCAASQRVLRREPAFVFFGGITYGSPEWTAAVASLDQTPEWRAVAQRREYERDDDYDSVRLDRELSALPVPTDPAPSVALPATAEQAAEDREEARAEHEWAMQAGWL